MATRRTTQEWETLLERYESSNITQRAFCEQNGLSLSTFFVKRRQRKVLAQPIPAGFARAEVIEEAPQYQAAQVEAANMTLLVNDVELSIPQGTPANYLAELIGALS